MASRKKKAVKIAKQDKAEAAEELGFFLGDMVSSHFDEHEDELADALATQICGSDLEEAGLKPTKEVLEAVLKEAMTYLQASMRNIVRKALAEYAQTGPGELMEMD